MILRDWGSPLSLDENVRWWILHLPETCASRAVSMAWNATDDKRRLSQHQQEPYSVQLHAQQQGSQGVLFHWLSFGVFIAIVLRCTWHVKSKIMNYNIIMMTHFPTRCFQRCIVITCPRIIGKTCLRTVHFCTQQWSSSNVRLACDVSLKRSQIG